MEQSYNELVMNEVESLESLADLTEDKITGGEGTYGLQVEMNLNLEMKEHLIEVLPVVVEDVRAGYQNVLKNPNINFAAFA